jgi:hypothetical protein
VSAVVKNTASVKKCVAQKSKSILYLENSQNTKKSDVLQVQNVEAVEVCCCVEIKCSNQKFVLK